MCTNTSKDVQANKKAAYTPEAERHFPGFIAFTDCTEQQIPRPENRRREKMHYSGKRKMHTVKTQVMVSNQGLIIHKASHKKGRRHDYDIHKKSHPATPKQVASVFDLGYLGVGRDYPEQIVIPAKQKETKHRIASEEKDYNKSHSKRRIVIEHTICKIKKCRILADIFRNRLIKYNRHQTSCQA